MISMTGFGFGEGSFNSYHFTVELKSYNNRYLDLILNIPATLSPWEPALRDWLAENISRGRVELTVRVRDNQDEIRVGLNLGAVRQYSQALRDLKKIAHIRQAVRLEHLLHFPEIFNTEKEKNNGDLWDQIQAIRDKVMNDFQQARNQEGRRLEEDVRRQLQVLAEGRQLIETQTAKMDVMFKENLRRKFEELAAEIDENRVLSETAMLLVRYGINEELVRLASHLEAFEKLLDEKGPVGKKLDFLCQEMGREINTIGSKTTFAEVQQKVVDMKDALENIREQLRNVE